jgi:MOSC domain-containing protein YiiM
VCEIVPARYRPVMPVIHSVNLGRAAPAAYLKGRSTGIDKRPVDHPVQVTAPGPKHVAGSGLAGDDVCNRRHHGGNDQAVYAYAREDLDHWAAELGSPLTSGSFGENLTTAGIDISAAILGEQWAIGEHLVLEISDPRIPCRTFAGFLGQRGWMRRFTQRADAGTYLRVVVPGEVSAGDPVTVVHRPAHGITVRTAFQAFTSDRNLMAELVDISSLSAEAQATVNNR